MNEQNLGPYDANPKEAPEPSSEMKPIKFLLAVMVGCLVGAAVHVYVNTLEPQERKFTFLLVNFLLAHTFLIWILFIRTDKQQ